jgi:hypothetical protein
MIKRIDASNGSSKTKENELKSLYLCYLFGLLFDPEDGGSTSF